MKSHLLQWIFKGVIIISSINFVYGQGDNCLTRAQQAYSDGHLLEVKDILNTCLGDLSRKEEKLQALYYITLANLYLNEKESAKESLIQLLRIDPEYTFASAPIEFKNFHDEFRVKPYLILGLKAGGNYSQIRALKTFSVDNASANNGTYKMLLGFQAGANLNVYLSRRLELGLEVLYRNLNFQFNNDNLLGFVNLTYTENQTLLEVPLFLKFNFGDNYNFGKDRRFFKNRLNPYIFLGGSLTNLLNVESTANRRDQTGGESTPLSIEATNLDMSDLRRRLNYNAVGGLGIEYKRGRNILAFEVRYNYNLQNIVKTENRYNNNELIFKYGYVDNDMLLNNLSFNIAYLHPLYKIREKKNTKQPKITGLE
ncbi:MAG: PorT family protein [Microscillaceae bacterium]|jgi:hypothetical protein|nr:PorT family protein [Microscillaceae bacterium]